ncbi:2OG-Fe(II) oxygenase family protein [Actinocrispum sp. NPDC049592]|uniref:2OG-Fe(II) oxygenase family protein n=1 Tax=Actinocrispum sp. NPDC049592 TaxID=3154835 RepID=UPI003417ED08
MGDLIWADLAARGLTVLELPGQDRLFQQARAFFDRSIDAKLRHSTADWNFGYRAQGHEYGSTPDRPDLNEVFTYWSDDPALVPHRELIGDFLGALRAYWDQVSDAAQLVLDTVAAHFGAENTLSFRKSSHIQINNYRSTDETRDLLQDCHEDGHLITLLTADGPGLEIVDGQRISAPRTEKDEVLVMAGSVLTAMTGGAVDPVYHQVRNHRLDRRISIMYFVNPDVGAPIVPFVHNEHNAGVDIADQVRRNPEKYGLPPL